MIKRVYGRKEVWELMGVVLVLELVVFFRGEIRKDKRNNRIFQNRDRNFYVEVLGLGWGIMRGQYFNWVLCGK